MTDGEKLSVSGAVEKMFGNFLAAGDDVFHEQGSNFWKIYTSFENPGITEKEFLAFFKTALLRNPRVERCDAEALGRLVLVRNWHVTLDHLIYESLCVREDLRPAVRVCISMLSLMTIWVLGVTPLSFREKWSSLEQTIIMLYPTKSARDDLLRRINGDSVSSSQAEVRSPCWQRALHSARKDLFHLKATELLIQMREDFPSNEHLRFVANDIHFTSWWHRWRR